jgi:predicted GTPase
MSSGFRCILLGAAGRDFHDVQTFFRERPELCVVAITAAQIPYIDARAFPRELAGPQYEADIPIFLESELPRLVAELGADLVFLAYSDLSNDEVMHKAALVQSLGASFVLLGPRQTELESRLPVIAVVAVRTGAGKSPLTQSLAKSLRDAGKRVAILRHPMPYGDLRKQAVQRFATEADLARFECTVEEREEYEPYVEAGLVVFAGVDYRSILAAAETEADVILWDGGNNDVSFLRADLTFVVVDALRPGHEVSYYPGETNLRVADVVVINKVAGASPEALDRVRANVASTNPRAVVLESDLAITVEPAGAIAGRRVLVIDDGPTVTHGGMSHGAGLIAAREGGAAEVIDPRPFAVGTIAEAYVKYPHLGPVLPALGYSDAQRRDLAATIAKSGADVIVDASPARIDRVIDVEIPVARVRYRFAQRTGKPVAALALAALASKGQPS